MVENMPINFTDELLTPKETAKVLKVTVGTLAVWRSTKKYDLKWVALGSRLIRYRRSEVYRFINDRFQGNG